MGGVAPPVGSPPLAGLFAIGYRQLIDGLHDRLRARGWTDIRPAFGFVLLAARDQPTSVTELAELMGMTKQAASKLVDAMVSGGYIQRGTDPQDGRQRPVSLTFPSFFWGLKDDSGPARSLRSKALASIQNSGRRQRTLESPSPTSFEPIPAAPFREANPAGGHESISCFRREE